MNKILKLYLDLETKTKEEGLYILKKDLKPSIVEKLVMDKRVIRDKIEKIGTIKMTSELKEKIKKILKNIISLEEENRQRYLDKISSTKSNILHVKNEKQLNNAYKKDYSIMQKNNIDKM